MAKKILTTPIPSGRSGGYSCGRYCIFERSYYYLSRRSASAAHRRRTPAAGRWRRWPRTRSHYPYLRRTSMKWFPSGRPPACAWKSLKKSLSKRPASNIVGKGGMGNGTMEGCRDYKAVHAVFPAGLCGGSSGLRRRNRRCQLEGLGHAGNALDLPSKRIWPAYYFHRHTWPESV